MNAHLDRLIDLAFDEDLGPSGDITTQATVAPNARAREPLNLAAPQVIRRFSLERQRVDAAR